jgi:hypothetical protein
LPPRESEVLQRNTLYPNYRFRHGSHFTVAFFGDNITVFHPYEGAPEFFPSLNFKNHIFLKNPVQRAQRAEDMLIFALQAYGMAHGEGVTAGRW